MEDPLHFLHPEDDAAYRDRSLNITFIEKIL